MPVGTKNLLTIDMLSIMFDDFGIWLLDFKESSSVVYIFQNGIIS